MLAARRWTTPCNVHPITMCTLAYMAGIAAQTFCYSVPALLTQLVLLFMVHIYHKHYSRTITYCILFFLGGTLGCALEQQRYEALYRDQNNKYTCAGTICDITFTNHPTFKKRITIALDSLAPVNRSAIKAPNCYLNLNVPSYDAGAIDDYVIVKNVTIKPPKDQRARIYTLRSKVIATHFTTPASYTLTKASRHSWQHWLFDLRNTTTIAVLKKLRTTAQQLYASLFLGNKTIKPLTTYDTNHFTLWGINHHLARSGLHLVIIIWIWFFCIQRLPVNTSIKHLTLMLLAVIYYALSWPSLSFDRACASFLLYQTCALNRMSPDPLHAISCIMLLFLVLSPSYLFCLDFQLSFGLTGALAWFNHAHTKL